MTKDITWETFEKTGEISIYLLFKEIENSKSNEDFENKPDEIVKVNS